MFTLNSIQYSMLTSIFNFNWS